MHTQLQSNKRKFEEEKKEESAQPDQNGRTESLLQKSDYIKTNLPKEGKHVTMLKEASSVSASQRKSRSVLNEDDLSLIYNYVLNDGKDSNGENIKLTHAQRVFYKGSVSDSFAYMQQVVGNRTLDYDNIEKTLQFAEDKTKESKAAYKEGKMEIALATLVDSNVLKELALGKAQNNSLCGQITNVMAI